MNIDITDEMIEQMVAKEVEKEVKVWFAQTKHEHIVTYYVEKAVEQELRGYKYTDVIQEEARKLINKTVMDRVCNQISDDIAQAFADKYGDY